MNIRAVYGTPCSSQYFCKRSNVSGTVDVRVRHGLSDHLSSLFRQKPEINMRLWKSADPSITTPLSSAITVKPGRPSFIITPKE